MWAVLLFHVLMLFFLGGVTAGVTRAVLGRACRLHRLAVDGSASVNLKPATFIQRVTPLVLSLSASQSRLGHTSRFLCMKASDNQCTGQSAPPPGSIDANTFCITTFAAELFILIVINKRQYMPDNLMGSCIPGNLPEVAAGSGKLVSHSR